MNQILKGVIFAIIIGWPLAAMLRQFFFSRRSGDGNSPGRDANGDYQFNTSPTAAPVSPIQAGETTVVWGTAPGGTAVAPVTSGLVVTSISITPHNGGPVTRIENGDGSCIDKVYLDDGFDAEVECLYLSGLTYPAIGVPAAITLTIPKAVDLSSGAVHTVFPCTLESNPLRFERKKEAMITFRVSHDPGVDGAPTS